METHAHTLVLLPFAALPSRNPNVMPTPRQPMGIHRDLLASPSSSFSYSLMFKLENEQRRQSPDTRPHVRHVYMNPCSACPLSR